jgi:hypothetical protein
MRVWVRRKRPSLAGTGGLYWIDHTVAKSSCTDSLAVRPQFTGLRSDIAFQLAFGFERVYAYSTTGGIDNATQKVMTR